MVMKCDFQEHIYLTRSICDPLSPPIIEKDTCHKGQMGVIINDDWPILRALQRPLDPLFRPDGMQCV